MGLDILRVPVLSDNYVWLAHDPASDETTVIDPAVAGPVLEAAAEKGWRITQLWNTHWHHDHTCGNAEINAAKVCCVTGPAADSATIPMWNRLDTEGDSDTRTVGQEGIR